MAFEKDILANAGKFCCYYPLKDNLAMVACCKMENLVGPLIYTGYDLGESGEVVLVNQDRKLLAPLKHPMPDGSRVGVLEHEIKGIPATLAAQGKDGSIIAPDYRGVPVFAAYRHIHVTPEVALGMVVKCDVNEVYAEFYRHKRIVGVIVLSGIFMLAVSAMVITKKMLSPLERLCNAVGHIGKGNFHNDVPVPRWGEMRRLAMVFNAMLHRVRNWNTELELKVRLTQWNMAVR